MAGTRNIWISNCTCEIIECGRRYVTDDTIITTEYFWVIFWKATLNIIYKSVILEMFSNIYFFLKAYNFLRGRLELWLSV